LEEAGVTRFPTPVTGRIPNFEGAGEAAERLADLVEFQEAAVIKVNPDSPQIPVRRKVLSEGKLLIMPTPRLREGFLILDPELIPRSEHSRAATIRGSFSHGVRTSIEEIPDVDLIVAGSVAVTRERVRVGKGGGYSELEYGILREVDRVGEDTPIATTVHCLQVVEDAPVEDHDFVLDVIATSEETIRVDRERAQPPGILWDRISEEMMEEMPVLRRLRESLETQDQ
jgi:5-formyltetrahydrofolate cyclo-ligase